MPERVLIVGFGAAGRRFARVVRYMADIRPNQVVLGGVCDTSPLALGEAAEFAPTFEDLETALRKIDPTSVIVAVNESAHAEVLHKLGDRPPRAVMCEKPLTATLSEALALPTRITSSALTVNLVERQSPVLSDYFDWAADRSGLRPLRVEFFWGKHRVADRRPTMGVLSEMTHPLDLVDYLFGFERLDIACAHAVSSDYSPHHPGALETVSLVGRADDYVVLGASSFAWPRRHRTITALLTDSKDELFRLTVDFDTPRWDCDHLILERIDRDGGARTTVLARAISNEMFPPALAGVAKVAGFVEQSIELSLGGEAVHSLVGYDQAVKLQRLLAQLETATGDSITHFELGSRETGLV